MRVLHWSTVAIFILAISLLANAMPSPVRVSPGVVSPPLLSGAVANGGVAQEEFSLIGVERVVTTDSERLFISYGDRSGQPWKGEPGFFQVALDHDGRRIVLDLSQMMKTGVDPTQLKKILAKSQYVASSEMTMDPQDLSTNLTFILKSPVELRVSTTNQKKSQLILDLKGLHP